MPPKLVVVTGPTASGKSALAMEIAQSLGGEVICADSRTVYKGLDIGTAKPTKTDQGKVRHHLLDIVEPGEAFNAAVFKHLANKAVVEITSRSKLPILVGGTGLYVDSVIFDYQFGPASRAEERSQLEALPIESLQQLCIDRGIGLPINLKNKRHLVRALEIGGSVSRSKTLRKNTFVVGITMNKEKLRERITLRARQMLEQGVLDEVLRMAQAYGWDNEAMKGSIYRIFKNVISGDKSIETGIQEFIQSDLHLARRQQTWLKRNPHIKWGEDPQKLLDLVKEFVQEKTE